MIGISLLILLMYLALIVSLYIGFNQVNGFYLKDKPPMTQFSIIIPFRNEVPNIPALLKSLFQLNYPRDKFEVILINDGSTDSSVNTITSFFKRYKGKVKYRIIDNQRLTNSPKKDAINTGVTHANYPYIITTDADVILPNYWLDSFDEYIQQNDPNLIVGPITYTGISTFLDRYQALDILSLQGSTIGAFGIKKPFLCNGANLCYSKTVFQELNAYKGNADIASGDDIFLLESMLKKDPKKVHYLKSKLSIVETKPEPSWSHLIHQRQRWAAKTSSYQLPFGKAVGIVVMSTNVLIITLPWLVVCNQLALNSALMLFLIKFSTDFLMLYRSSRFFEQTELLSSVVLTSILYPVLNTYILAKSLMSPFLWKGRKFKS